MTVAVGAALVPAVATATTATPPPGFQPSATSWLTPTTGVVLGYTQCPQTTWCATLLATTDGGTTWRTRTPPPLRIPDNSNQVDIQLVNRTTAIANDGNHIEITRDGATTWRPITIADFPDSGSFIAELAVAHHKLYAVASTFGQNGAATLYAAPLTASTLTPVPGLTITGQGFTYGDVTTKGGAIQVRLGADLANSEYWTSTDGEKFTREPDPCPATNSTRLGGVLQHQVIALCVGDGGDPQPGSNPKQWTSAPGLNQPFTLGGQAPFPGETTDFAAATATSATVSAEAGDVYFLYSTFDGGATWTTTLADGEERGLVLSDLDFVSPTTGFVQVGQPNTFGEPPVVYRTTDGGHTWQQLVIS